MRKGFAGAGSFHDKQPNDRSLRAAIYGEFDVEESNDLVYDLLLSLKEYADENSLDLEFEDPTKEGGRIQRVEFA